MNNANTENMINLIGKLCFFEPVEFGEAAFSVGVYCDAEQNNLINATDLFLALGIRGAYVRDKIYHYINTLELKQGKDYFIKSKSDPIVDNQPEYIFNFAAAKRIAQEVEGDIGKAAFAFFEMAEEYTENDLLRMFCYDILVRMPVFTFAAVASVLQGVKYNDGVMDEETLVKMLKKDKLLTRALLPTKGNELYFTKLNGKTCLTVQGLNYLARKYMGLPIDMAVSFTLQNMPLASRKVSPSMFDESRIERIVTDNEVIVDE